MMLFHSNAFLLLCVKLLNQTTTYLPSVTIRGLTIEHFHHLLKKVVTGERKRKDREEIVVELEDFFSEKVQGKGELGESRVLSSH